MKSLLRVLNHLLAFGFLSPNHKIVQKQKIESKIVAAAWTDDGLFLAIGMICGKISIRDGDGKEKACVSRSAPIWGLVWKPKPFDDGDSIDILVVSCWDKSISFYNLFGEPCYKEQSIGYYPCNISLLYGKTELMISSGSNRQTTLFAGDATKICNLTNSDKWMWACKVNSSGTLITTGDNGREITVYNLKLNDVFCFSHGRYLCHVNMTNITMQHTQSNQQTLIRGRDLIKHASVYGNKFAIQLSSEKIRIYEECNQTANLQ